MCFGGNAPAAQTAPAAPPPPPMDAPASPAFNEDTSEATNASDRAANSRAGRRSLRVDLNKAAPADTAAVGLNIPLD